MLVCLRARVLFDTTTGAHCIINSEICLRHSLQGAVKRSSKFFCLELHMANTDPTYVRDGEFRFRVFVHKGEVAALERASTAGGVRPLFAVSPQ